MNIGYLYGFNSYPPKNGGGVHVYNLIHNLRQLGAQIHTFDHEQSPLCVTYPMDDAGIKEFLKNIDILYIRIDGWYLSATDWKIRCMEQAASIPIVWEINAPIEERLMLHKYENQVTTGGAAVSWLKRKISYKKLRSMIEKENNCRRRYAKKVDAAICVSDEIAAYASSQLGIKKVIVVPNGSNPALFSPEKKNDELFKNYRDHIKVIYSGDSRYPWQGFSYVRDLASMARRKGDKFLFIALDNSSSGFTVEEENLLIYNLNYLDVPAYLASADVCLCLYNDEVFSSFKYIFNLSPLKLFDYMASGKPVIASRLGQIQTVIEDGKDGMLTSNDINDIYEKLLFCRQQKDKARQMGNLARGKVMNCYNWERASRSTLELFNTLSQNCTVVT